MIVLWLLRFMVWLALFWLAAMGLGLILKGLALGALLIGPDRIASWWHALRPGLGVLAFWLIVGLLAWGWTRRLAQKIRWWRSR